MISLKITLKSIEDIKEKILEGIRITEEEAVLLLHKADLLTLGALAHYIRRKLHPERLVTYIVDRNINYTNICLSKCRFCAFFREEGAKDAYLISKEELAKKIEETIQLGGTQILLQGGLHPGLTIDYYEDLLKFIKVNYPIIHIHGFSPPEIVHISHQSGLSIEGVIIRLKASGLDSIPGGGAEILVNEVREQVSPGKCRAGEWLEVMETAHNCGLKTTATMMFGHLEGIEDRLTHLARIRDLQDKTRGFTAFIPWPFQPGNTPIPRPATSGFEYLKMLAVSRIFLDNIKNIQASWVTQGDKVAQLALQFGANDLGSTMIEENVVAAAGVSFRLPESELIRLIEDAGFRAGRRNMEYALL